MPDASLILKYFPDLSEKQIEQFNQLYPLYQEWNNRINVISRKNIEELYVNHVLHSLAIAKFIDFPKGTKVLDIGTGGGFPGIPLAILFPEVQFHLVDSIAKKIKVVNEISNEIGLQNVVAEQVRAEKVKQKYHFVISRAVTQLATFKLWLRNKFEKENIHPHIKNGVIYLKGGDLTAEFKAAKIHPKQILISKFFEEPFFETKKIIYFKGEKV